jgi:hypothetical protein
MAVITSPTSYRPRGKIADLLIGVFKILTGKVPNEDQK